MSHQRDQLKALGAERLAEVLDELAAHDGAAAAVVERLLSSSAERVKRLRAKLKSLSRRKKFIDYRAAAGYARELEQFLDEVRADIADPEVGIDLVSRFFVSDENIFEQTDDSSGSIGDAFRFTAAELFAHFAAKIPDKASLVQRMLKLYEDDGYGVRYSLFERVASFLPESHSRELADTLFAQARASTDDRPYHEIVAILAIARQIRDSFLFEAAELHGVPVPNDKIKMEIAKAHLEAGHPEECAKWLARVPVDCGHWHYERERLQFELEKATGNAPAATETAWKLFRSSRSEYTLKDLLEVIGDEQRADVINSAVAEIIAGSFNLTDARFLLFCERFDELAVYIQSHRAQLDGGRYESLVPIADALRIAGYALAASLIYRALIDSILLRARAKIYHHAVEYLHHLDALAAEVTDWSDGPTHAEYVASLRNQHGRKTAFWGAYAADEV
jgi:hypothetical protein